MEGISINTNNNINPQTYYKKNKLQQLKGFCYTVQIGTVKDAAIKMGLETSSISNQILSLESELDVKLFDRIGKKLIPTELGQRLYVKASNILNSFDNLFDEFLLERNSEYRNRLSIASFDAGINKMLKYVLDFKKANPEANISLNIMDREEASKALINKELDFAFYPMSVIEEKNVNIETIVCSKYISYFIMNKHHKLAKKKYLSKNDLMQNEFCYIPELINIKNFKHFLDANKINNAINIKNGTIDILKNIIYYSDNISILAEIYFNKEDFNKFTLKSTNRLFKERDYLFFTHKNKKQLTEKFLNFMVKNFKLN